ncbi:MAG TPA: tetraacyldisaccharide 4'-kinase [Bryobacteraceae bacterium]|nr:tetraacyldisaccharide 4'-kinase [Bryobacteraceae bacterium]
MKRKAIFLLYRVVQTLASPAVVLYLLARAAGDRRYLATLRERLGGLSALWQKTAPEAIWLHAVSVGEVLAAVPLAAELRRRTPQTPVFVSTSTLAGRETAAQRLAGLVDGIFYAPLDYVWIVRRVLRRIRPSIVVVLETEIWPNLFREAKRIGCGLLIVNGRISDRALPRYRKYAPFFGPVLSLCDRILAQSDEMRERFAVAGAPREILETAGNLKYDFQLAPLPPDSPVGSFIAAGQGRRLWIAASTSTDGRIEEEDDVIAAQRSLSGWRLIVAPRKPVRFDAVAKKLESSGLRWSRRSQWSPGDQSADVLLLDSIGELGGTFEYADAVFMGGTISDMGGHNILEPAMAGKPVIAGPHLENFREIEQHFEAERALLRIKDGSELASAVACAATDSELGRRAHAAAAMKCGAAARTADAVMALYETRYPTERIAQPAWMLLRVFSQLWRIGSANDLRSKRARMKRLPVPVVSVGNITAGGTGKTPITLELLRDLAPLKPAVLTRGHGRNTRDTVLLPRGDEKAPVERTGDEAQLYLRSAHVPIGIGTERATAGARLLENADVRVFLLDDGLQHVQLHRDFDLVVVDALRPFGGGNPLPLGRLREPLSALARADAFIITRSRAAANLPAIISTLRTWNVSAPVYLAWQENRQWRNGSGERRDVYAMAGSKSIAFCGLGNPESFWRSLSDLGVTPVEKHSFGDHHRYTPNELRRLARHAHEIGVEYLLTTAKDSVNLGDYETATNPLQVWWLEIGVGIDGRDDLVARIRHCVTG